MTGKTGNVKFTGRMPKGTARTGLSVSHTYEVGGKKKTPGRFSEPVVRDCASADIRVSRTSQEEKCRKAVITLRSNNYFTQRIDVVSVTLQIGKLSSVG